MNFKDKAYYVNKIKDGLTMFFMGGVFGAIFLFVFTLILCM